MFRLVARFGRVRIEDYSGNRFASTAYFAKPGFVGGGECSGGKQPGCNLPGGNIPVTAIKPRRQRTETYSDSTETGTTAPHKVKLLNFMFNFKVHILHEL